jgi:hypothetical protein
VQSIFQNAGQSHVILHVSAERDDRQCKYHNLDTREHNLQIELREESFEVSSGHLCKGALGFMANVVRYK